jgi:hypothetical protein
MPVCKTQQGYSPPLRGGERDGNERLGHLPLTSNRTLFALYKMHLPCAAGDRGLLLDSHGCTSSYYFSSAGVDGGFVRAVASAGTADDRFGRASESRAGDLRGGDDRNQSRGLGDFAITGEAGMKASEYVTVWQDAAAAGHALQVGELTKVETVAEAPGRQYKLYTFGLQAKDRPVHNTWLQIKVREKRGQAELEDFWPVE